MPCIVEVIKEVIARYQRKAALQLSVGSRRVDKHQIEEEQTQESQEAQDQINDDSGDQQFYFCTFIFISLHLFPFLLRISIDRFENECRQDSRDDEQQY